MSHGYKLVTDGTVNHLVLWDLRKEVRRQLCVAIIASYPRHLCGFATRLWAHGPAQVKLVASNSVWLSCVCGRGV